MKSILSYIILFVLCCNSTIAQLQFWNSENGLSNEWVSTVMQDTDGLIWIGTQYGLNRFDGYEFQKHQYNPDNNHSLSANWVKSVTMDQNGQFWLVLYLGGIQQFDPKTGKATTRYHLEDGQQKVINSRNLICDADNNIWVSGPQGLFLKNAQDSVFTKINDYHIFDLVQDQNGQIHFLTNTAIFKQTSTNNSHIIYEFEPRSVRRFFIDHRNKIWLIQNKQVGQLINKNKSAIFQTLAIKNLPQSEYFFESPIYEDRKKQLWIGGSAGVTIINAERNSSKTISYNDLFPKGVDTGNALCFFEDQHNNIWIGTNSGLLMDAPINQRFRVEATNPILQEITGVREILKTKNQLWISNKDGLYLSDPSNSTPIKVLPHQVYSLLKTKNNEMYAGTLFGLYKINIETLKTEFYPSKKTKEGLQGRMIWDLAEDTSGKIWIGAVGRLQRFDPIKNTFEQFKSAENPTLEDSPAQTLFINSKGHLWAGSVYSGVYLLENPTTIKSPDNAPFIQFNYHPDNKNSLSNRVTLVMTEDQNGYIWVGTDGGLNRIDPNTREVKRYLEKDGLIDEKIMGLVVDNDNNLWGSTIGHGIFKLDNNDQFSFYGRRDGIVSNNFLIGAVYKDEAGLLYFGSDQKTQVIDPSKVIHAYKQVIDCRFSNIHLAKNEKNKGIYPTITNNKVLLPHHYQSFSIDFSTLHFHQADKTTYQYKLEGLHSDWQSNKSARTIQFTGLPPDEYVLKARAINADLDFTQNDYTLYIEIQPPWWKQNWAKLLYGILFLGIFYGIYRFQLHRKLEQAEAVRLQELDGLKTRLYTNITHELRTPLTIILGMSEQLIQVSQQGIIDKATLIQRNGRQLLELINQMLDLSKLEAGKLPVQWVHGDLLSFLNYLIESFHSLANNKGIQLHFLPELTALEMDYDEEKIKQIISNLLFNAIKYTPQNGNIYVQIKPKSDTAILQIRDTGKGINPTELERIFDRFYQTENKAGGTGIGLALTRELVHLLGGKIQVKSIIQKGTTFEITLPIHHKKGVKPASVLENPILQKEIKSSTIIVENQNQVPDNAPLILIIEDNSDVLQYLVDSLQKQYRIIVATNGEIGIQKAQEQIPDLIVSDVMMPQKDGFEVCHTIKTDIKTNHIPVILLTAKVDVESKIKGLEFGADAYLAKPFEQRELHIRIKKLLELRQQLQARYQDVRFWENTPPPTFKPVDAFVLQVRQLIEKNISDDTFGIPQICKSIGISRVHLHRKLKALTNQSTSHFIRRIRLQKAKTLLQTTDFNVSEVAYEVGFKDPAYFSRLYTELFGKTPSETRK